MRAHCAAPLTTSLRLILFALLSFFGGTGYAAAIQCSDYAPYTIKITNDTSTNPTKYNIFPVIDTPANDADEWLQAGFNVPKAQLTTLTYGHAFKYRLYIKPNAGLAPGDSVTITLPLCTQLLANPTGTIKDEYIDWWNGGRVYIYDSPVGSPPPAAFTKDFNKDKLNVVTPLLPTPRPTCVGCPLTEPPIYRDSNALPANDPQQLLEYTIGGIRKETVYSIDPAQIVDFDISYVDHVYLPAAMGPVGNPDIGYIGTADTVDKFRLIVTDFLGDYRGWPKYLDPVSQQPYLRIPGAYNAFAQWNPLEKTIIQQPGAAILTMSALWKNCTTTGDPSQVCNDIRTVNGFFLQNYTQYQMLWLQGLCKPPKPPTDPTPSLDEMLKKVYGWVPWNEYCSGGAAANSLSDTPHYDQTHQTYTDLQYTSLAIDNANKQFNPYVILVHGKTYLDMQGSYAFSIDDDVGNMQVLATGINISIGGPDGLDNKIPYDKSKLVNVNLGAPRPQENEPDWSQYGFCDGNPVRNFKNPQDLSFAITSAAYPCTVALTDLAGRKYLFTLADPTSFAVGPPLTTNPLDPKYTAPITSCTVNGKTGTDWCSHAFAYKTGTGLKTLNYVQLNPPPPIK